METLTQEEAVARWDEILERAENGEVITVTRNGKPVVRLVKYEHPIANKRAKEPA